MPQQQALPTWVTLNSMNSGSPSGMADPITNFPYEAGGLNVGDYFDLTDDEALSASNTTTGTLFSGRYRYVQVDSGATAANVKTGTVGYIRSGSTVKTVVVTNAGTGQTAGTYQISATFGNGGTGAIIQVIVGSGGTITSASVVNGGLGYTAAPPFSLTALGGSGGAVVAQLNTSPNLVTSADIATNAVRPVVFLNSITPGNYGFIQELGTATVIVTASQTQAINQFAIVKSSSPDGTMTASSATLTPFAIGQVIDALTTPPAGTGFKIQLGYAAGVVQD